MNVIFRFVTGLLMLMLATQSYALDFGINRDQPLTDDAQLVTLEEGENETSPRIQPNAQEYAAKFLVSSWKRGKNPAISSRMLENGDPLNELVNDDPAGSERAFGWEQNGNIYYLSTLAGSLGLWSVAGDGQGAITRLFRLQGNWIQPVLLPDGSLIAVHLNGAKLSDSENKHRRSGFDFANWDVHAQNSQIVHISKDGVEKVLADGINPAVLPDGKTVVFSMPAGRSMHLFRVDVDGNHLTQLTHERSVDVEPAISADGRWIAFTSNRGDADMRHSNGGNWDIWVMDFEGRELQRLTLDEGRDGSPAFAGDSVYFHSDRKVTKEQQAERKLRGNTAGFHIWRIAFEAPKTN